MRNVRQKCTLGFISTVTRKGRFIHSESSSALLWPQEKNGTEMFCGSKQLCHLALRFLTMPENRGLSPRGRSHANPSASSLSGAPTPSKRRARPWRHLVGVCKPAARNSPLGIGGMCLRAAGGFNHINKLEGRTRGLTDAVISSPPEASLFPWQWELTPPSF